MNRKITKPIHLLLLLFGLSTIEIKAPDFDFNLNSDGTKSPDNLTKGPADGTTEHPEGFDNSTEHNSNGDGTTGITDPNQNLLHTQTIEPGIEQAGNNPTTQQTVTSPLQGDAVTPEEAQNIEDVLGRPTETEIAKKPSILHRLKRALGITKPPTPDSPLKEIELEILQSKKPADQKLLKGLAKQAKIKLAEATFDQLIDLKKVIDENITNLRHELNQTEDEASKNFLNKKIAIEEAINQALQEVGTNKLFEKLTSPYDSEKNLNLMIEYIKKFTPDGKFYRNIGAEFHELIKKAQAKISESIARDELTKWSQNENGNSSIGEQYANLLIMSKKELGNTLEQLKEQNNDLLEKLKLEKLKPAPEDAQARRYLEALKKEIEKQLSFQEKSNPSQEDFLSKPPQSAATLQPDLPSQMFILMDNLVKAPPKTIDTLLTSQFPTITQQQIESIKKQIKSINEAIAEYKSIPKTAREEELNRKKDLNTDILSRQNILNNELKNIPTSEKNSSLNESEA